MVDYERRYNMANGVQGQMQKPGAANAANAAGVSADQSSGGSKKWLWWTIGIVIILVIIGLVIWL